MTNSNDYDPDEPFRRIQAHRDVLDDIQQMEDNLQKLKSQVRVAEWVALGGRGAVGVEQVERLCDGIEDSMPYIKEDIKELAEANRDD